MLDDFGPCDGIFLYIFLYISEIWWYKYGIYQSFLGRPKSCLFPFFFLRLLVIWISGLWGFPNTWGCLGCRTSSNDDAEEQILGGPMGFVADGNSWGKLMAETTASSRGHSFSDSADLVRFSIKPLLKHIKPLLNSPILRSLCNFDQSFCVMEPTLDTLKKTRPCFGKQAILSANLRFFRILGCFHS